MARHRCDEPPVGWGTAREVASVVQGFESGPPSEPVVLTSVSSRTAEAAGQAERSPTKPAVIRGIPVVMKSNTLVSFRLWRDFITY